MRHFALMLMLLGIGTLAAGCTEPVEPVEQEEVHEYNGDEHGHEHNGDEPIEPIDEPVDPIDEPVEPIDEPIDPIDPVVEPEFDAPVDDDEFDDDAVGDDD